MAKTVGMIGGIAPESTIEYYRFIIRDYCERVKDGSHPQIYISSIDLRQMLDRVAAGKLEEVAQHIGGELKKLAAAGAEIGVLASNTPHLVFDQIQRLSPIPLVSIVEATCERAKSAGLKKLALFGTRYTMEGGIYPGVFSRAGITIVLPNQQEISYIHDHYMQEFVFGVFLDETRKSLMTIVQAIKERDGIDGLILGGTELPLILRQAEASAGIP